MLKISEKEDLKDLIYYYGFEQADFNDKYFIRYINLDKEPNYETLYVDKETREIFAYDDYEDKKIPMQDDWIMDILFLVEKKESEDK